MLLQFLKLNLISIKISLLRKTTQIFRIDYHKPMNLTYLLSNANLIIENLKKILGVSKIKNMQIFENILTGYKSLIISMYSILRNYSNFLTSNTLI